MQKKKQLLVVENKNVNFYFTVYIQSVRSTSFALMQDAWRLIF